MVKSFIEFYKRWIGGIAELVRGMLGYVKVILATAVIVAIIVSPLFLIWWLRLESLLGYIVAALLILFVTLPIAGYLLKHLEERDERG